MNHYYKCFEVFGLAVYELAVSDHSLRARLRKAIDEIFRSREQDVPEQLQAKYSELIAFCKSGRQEYQEPWAEATVRQLTDEECIQLASDIIAFNNELYERKTF